MTFTQDLELSLCKTLAMWVKEHPTDTYPSVLTINVEDYVRWYNIINNDANLSECAKDDQKLISCLTYDLFYKDICKKSQTRYTFPCKADQN